MRTLGTASAYIFLNGSSPSFSSCSNYLACMVNKAAIISILELGTVVKIYFSWFFPLKMNGETQAIISYSLMDELRIKEKRREQVGDDDDALEMFP